MKGTVRKITTFGDTVMYLIRLEDGKYGRTYTGHKYRNYVNWKDLKIGDHVEGLAWKNKERGLIDADAPVHIFD